MVKLSSVSMPSLAVAVVLLGLAGLTQCRTADEMTPVEQVEPEVPDSADVEGPVFVSGELEIPESAAGEEGFIVLMAWPANEELATMELDEEFPMDALAKAAVAPDGSFELRLADVEVLAKYGGESGAINFDMDAEFGDYFYTTGFGTDMEEINAAIAKNVPVEIVERLAPISKDDE
ncbi:MAG: hypothetical protein ACK5LO_00125 [Leucobacter sp.]